MKRSQTRNNYGYPLYKTGEGLNTDFARRLAAGDFTVILSRSWACCREGDMAAIKSCLRHAHVSKRTLRDNA